MRIKEDEPPRPSLRFSGSKESLPLISQQRQSDPAQLPAWVRGELDWIVMKCLDKDRSRRYETANGLARDLERHLADEPVEACPPSSSYRLRKLARKYRKPLAGAAAFAVLMLAGFVVSGWQALRATHAETMALAAEETATRERDRALAAERLATERLVQLTKEKHRADEALEKANSEHSQREDLWKHYSMIDAWVGAVDFEEKGAHQLADNLLFLRLLPLIKETAGKANVGGLSLAGKVGDFYRRRKTPEKAERWIRELRDFQREHPDPREEEHWYNYCPTLEAFGLNLLEQHNWKEAKAVLRECLTLREKQTEWVKQQLARAPGPRLSMSLSGNARSMLGESLLGQKNYTAAEPYLLQGYNEVKSFADLEGKWAGLPASLFPLQKALERLVQLYEVKGEPGEVAKWRKELEATKTTGKPAAGL
jgi:hypothetical protein